MGDVVAQWSGWRHEIDSSNHGQCVYVVLLGKTLNSHNASLHPSARKYMETTDDMLGGDL